MNANPGLKVHTMKTDRDPLNLSSLPPVDSPEDGWPVIEAALREDSDRHRTWKATIASLAIAASITLALGLLVRQTWQETGPVNAEPPPLVVTEEPVDTSAPTSDQLASLIGMSQKLESQLRRIRTDAPLTMTTSLVYQVELQDLVAQVDRELSYDPESTVLWAQRVNLLLDLRSLYQNELRRESAQMASL